MSFQAQSPAPAEYADDDQLMASAGATPARRGKGRAKNQALDSPPEVDELVGQLDRVALAPAERPLPELRQVLADIQLLRNTLSNNQLEQLRESVVAEGLATPEEAAGLKRAELAKRLVDLVLRAADIRHEVPEEVVDSQTGELLLAPVMGTDGQAHDLSSLLLQKANGDPGLPCEHCYGLPGRQARVRDWLQANGYTDLLPHVGLPNGTEFMSLRTMSGEPEEADAVVEAALRELLVAGRVRTVSMAGISQRKRHGAPQEMMLVVNVGAEGADGCRPVTLQRLEGSRVLQTTDLGCKALPLADEVVRNLAGNLAGLFRYLKVVFVLDLVDRADEAEGALPFEEGYRPALLADSLRDEGFEGEEWSTSDEEDYAWDDEELAWDDEDAMDGLGFEDDMDGDYELEEAVQEEAAPSQSEGGPQGPGRQAADEVGTAASAAPAPAPEGTNGQ